MSETKHTPGPWVWDGDGGICQVGTPPYSYGKAVLRPTYEYDSGVDTEVSEADANLIAAAPDLLDALKGLLADITEYQEINNLGGENNHWQVISRAAIAKAEGRA